MTLAIEISPGELIDRITILEIKLARMTDPDKLRNVRRDYDQLLATLDESVPRDPDLVAMRAELKEVNAMIWQVEDDIRAHERKRDFGDGFVALARAVYINNDRRAALKRRINQHLSSALTEEKSYAPY